MEPARIDAGSIPGDDAVRELFAYLLVAGWVLAICKLARVDRRASKRKETPRMDDNEPLIEIDRVEIWVMDDICSLRSHDRETGRVFRTILPRTPGKPIDYDYDFYTAVLIGAPVTYQRTK